MESSPKFSPLFPEGMSHLNEQFEQSKQRLNAIDYELENAPKDEVPNPKNRPQGPEGRDANMRDRREKYLDDVREKIVKKDRIKVEKQIDGLSDKERQTILSRFDHETGKNGFKAYTKNNLQEVSDLEKDEKLSMDYMEARHFSQYHMTEKSIANEKENIGAWSDRYLNLLNEYKSHSDIEMGKEDIEPDRNL